MSHIVAISMIVPVYRIPEPYLIQCVESIRNQSFQDFELFLVDDNNNQDPSGRLCDRFAAENDRFHAVHQENQGVSVARNNGLARANGQWIAFVDPDDWLEPDYLEKLYAAAMASAADIVMCSCYANYVHRENKNEFFKYATKRFTGEEKDEILLQLICRGINDYFPPESGAGVPWAKLYKRAFIEQHHLRFDPELIRMQDNIFNLQAIERADSIYYFNEFLYHYRRNSGSATNKYNPNIVNYIERVNDATERFIKENHKKEIFYKALHAKILTGFNNYFTLYYCPALMNRKHRYVELKAEILALLRKPMYQTALKHVDRDVFTGKERLYVALLRRRMVACLFLLTMLRNLYKRMRNGSPDQ